MRYALLISAMLFSTTWLPAQALSAADSAQIQQRALRHVRQFEGLLNLIAQPDEYFRKYSFAKLIQSFYEENSDYQIFRDSLSTVEDDINPKALPEDNNLLTIKDYLKAFFSLYKKSPVASVFFGKYEVSPVQTGDFVYVEVFFDSEFTNEHRIYSTQPYPIRRKKATLRAELVDNEWKLVITDVSFNQPDKLLASLSENPTSGRPNRAAQQLDSLASDESTASPDNTSLEALSGGAADSSSTVEVLEALNRDRGYQLTSYNNAPVPPANAPPSLDPLVIEIDESSGQNSGVFEGFTPMIRRAGKSSIQVVFTNPASDSLSVTLNDSEGRVLFLEKAAGQQRYVQSINLMKLNPGQYQVKIYNEGFDHSASVYYRYEREQNDAAEEPALADAAEGINFEPYIMKQKWDSSVQVVFKNQLEETLLVELVDSRGRVLYDEKVESQQEFARSINMVNLPKGYYRVKVYNEDYERSVSITY